MPITRNSAMKTDRNFAAWRWGALTLLAVVHLNAAAEIKLLGDWEPDPPCGGPPLTMNDLHDIQAGLKPRPACSKSETEKLEEANWISLRKRIATILEPDGTTLRKFFGQGFRLHFDGDIFYLQAIGFMPKSRLDEVCTLGRRTKETAYQCLEGQRYTVACHIAIYNRQFEEIGWHTVRINESYPIFCNAIPGLGRLDAKHDDVLAVVQYFSVAKESKLASKISEVGSDWNRMTVRLKLRKTGDGRVEIEQDDRCLGNPNTEEEIPEARVAIRRCEKSAR